MNPIELEQNYVLQTYKRPNFVLERGDGVWLYDSNGKQYLDAGSGIAVTSLGHNHPTVVKAIKDGAEGLTHVSNLYHTAPQGALARDLCETSFADRVYFCNSGAEANEGTIKFARRWGRSQGEDRHHVIALTGSFHGRTMGALALTSREKYRTPFEPLIGGVSFAEFNDLDSVRAQITPQTCAIICEPIQGEGGVNPATPEFLHGLRALCDEHNILLILDEIQCGLGRTGTLWAHQGYGVEPDMMSVAKPLGGGLPIGAVLMKQHVANTIQPGDHGSTFAAGPLVCHVAHAVFQAVNEPSLMAQMQVNGDYLAKKLHELPQQTPLITSVRGKGMMWGLQTPVPAAEVMAEAYNHNLMILVAGPDIIRLLPALTISQTEIDTLVERLLETLAAVG